MPQYAVILPAAGSSSRFRDQHFKKPFAPLAGRAVWMHAAEKFLNRDDVKQLLVIIAPSDREEFLGKFGANLALMGIEWVEGGKERADSVQNALARVRADIDFVAIHDAARPCLAEAWISQVFETAARTGAALLATPVTATLKRVNAAHTVQETATREGLWEAQTPQVFRRQLLLDAYAHRGPQPVTDDAQVVERFGHPVTVVAGSALNMKITTRDDLRLAEAVLKVLPKPRLLGPEHPFKNDELFR